MEFNEKLQKLRKQRGLTQEELAESLFVSRTAISKWEQGRGYPSIDSLKAIAKLFSVTIDDLLSGEEILSIAEKDSKEKESHLRSLVFSLLDCSIIIFFFLPFFGQKADGVIEAVSLLSFSGASLWLKTAYFTAASAMILWGILTLALKKQQSALGLQNKISLILNAIAALLFIVSLQPYAAAFLFIFLAIKASMLMKWP